MKHLQAPFTKADLATLEAGESVLVTGTIYTARDAAHARLCDALSKGQALPLDLRNQTIFYAGPTPPPPHKPTGAIGPTTSYRMDPYTPALLQYGVNALIGKGERGEAVMQALAETGSVYFVAIGGCAAYMARCITACDVVAYDDLGTESIKKLTVVDLPLVVAVDAHGKDAYASGVKKALAFLDDKNK